MPAFNSMLISSIFYVGNLAPKVSEADLRLLFSRAGAVSEVRLVLDPSTQQPRGHAFVTMADPKLAAAALGELHRWNLGGRHINVTEARPPQEPKGMMREGFASGASSHSSPGPRRDKTQRHSPRSSRPRGRPR